MIISLENVSWRREQTMILQNMNWQVQQGQHWCIVGLNGSGKTTMLNVVNGYIWPTQGQVEVLGHRFGDVDLRELRKRIGWVSTSLQQKLYGHQTALNIVLSGKFATIGLYDKTEEEDLKQAEELLEFLDCSALATRTYDTLSQGQRQKILIARALIANPELLILDEPCTGLDIFAREQLLQMIEKITKQEGGPTLLYVTHHIEEIAPCFTHTLLVKKGEIYKAAGTAECLKSEVLSDFFDTPVEVQEHHNRKWLTLG
ncbi:ABC transporter ATP-binding protein [Paenibacillus piscarius]|uniref:ABC transporter ATP-binding protein n=1 Tax=Paenibacillus piscarius TaxID=1089681 RepID=UPI001EE9761A|nr:ABC transporter ATP-binding protein [Paenibacillus piscarius]